MGDDASRLTPERRTRDIARLASDPLDVLIVGGGVTGAGAALDAATRGISVGLVEAQDFGSGSSSRSSKLIHGGLRYLEMLDFSLIRQALTERGLLLSTIAPHLVHPIPILYPLRRRGIDRALVGAGVALYDLLAVSTRSSRGVPLHRHLSHRHSLALAPALRSDALVGAVEYFDAQVDDARFVIALVRTAVSLGVTAVSRLKVSSILRDGDRVLGVRANDLESGKTHDIRACTVVLATGAWSEETEALAGRERAVRVRPSKGVHLLVPREKIPSSVALILRTKVSVLFVLPWGNHWLIGTTDTDWEYEKARPLATESDVDYLLTCVNEMLAWPLSRSDVVASFAGLRPLVAGVGVVRGPRGDHGTRIDKQGASESTTEISREHAVGRPIPGLVVVSGGKFTTYRVMATDAIDAAVDDGGVAARAPSTELTALVGADRYRALFADRAALAEAHRISVSTVEHLLRRYGSLAEELFALVDADPSLAERVDERTPYLRCEVLYAVTSEGARHLEDVLERRTRIAIESPDEGLVAAQSVAAQLAPLLGWDDEAVRAELDDYRSKVDLERRVRASAHSDEEAARLIEKTPSRLALP